MATCATCGFLGIRNKDGQALAADAMYRSDAQPMDRNGRLRWTEPVCHKGLVDLAEEASTVFDARDGLAQRPDFYIAFHPDPQDFAAVFSLQRQCPGWKKWQPGKSLEGHMDTPGWFHYVYTAVQLVAGLGAAGLGLAAAANAISRLLNR